MFYITAFIKSRDCLVSQIVVESGPVPADPRTVQSQSHNISSSEWFCSVRLDISLCGSSFAVYTCVTGIVYSEHCTPLVCNTCWVGWEYYISHCFKITNNLELSALKKVEVYRKRWCPTEVVCRSWNSTQHYSITFDILNISLIMELLRKHSTTTLWQPYDEITCELVVLEKAKEPLNSGFLSD